MARIGKLQPALTPCWRRSGRSVLNVRPCSTTGDPVAGIRFRITDWAAWAPGLESPDDWLAWARNAFVPHGDATPALAQVAPMQRRRIDRLGRAAIQAADGCRRSDDAEAPLVFVSRHGDVARSFALLEALCAQQPMSPTQFGLSVHNAIAALYSIVHGVRGNYTALAGGKASIETALVEAAGLLADGAASVTLVYCDAHAPRAYEPFFDEPDAFYAFAWRVRADNHGAGRRLSLSWETDAEPAREAAGLPQALAAHRFLLSGETVHSSRAEGVHWQWHQDA